MTDLTAKTEYWYASAANVNALARWLYDNGMFDEPDDVLQFFEEPWQYATEWDHLHSRKHVARECVICTAGTDGLPDKWPAAPNVASINPTM